jgi:hypothetical protein
MPDPIFPYTAVDGSVLDTLFQTDGTQVMKAAGRTINITDPDAPIESSRISSPTRRPSSATADR